MKRINQIRALWAVPLLILLSCSKGSSYEPPATPANLSYQLQIEGAASDAPGGDGSGIVHLHLSGKNVTSYAVSLPTENKKYALSGSSGSIDVTFNSGVGKTTKYPIQISAYCNTVKVDTTLYAEVYVRQPETPGTVLVWSDEFDSTALNTKVWNYETGNLGVNNELEYYTKDAANLQVKDGCYKLPP